MNICICGGGNLGHSIAGRAAAVLGDSGEVRLLTRRPEAWSQVVCVEDDLGHVYAKPLALITDDAGLAVKGADIILLCIPGYGMEEELLKLRPHLTASQMVGTIVSSTGFFFQGFRILGADAPLFGFQRVPFVARLSEYGHRSSIRGYRKQVWLAASGINPDRQRWLCAVFQSLLGTPVEMLENYLEAALTNSNPILHTGRLYSMWHDWDGTPFESQSYFYRDWTDDASRTLIDMDSEFFMLLKALNVREGAVKPLLEHYESWDAASMTRKISTIPSLHDLRSPMRQVEGGWIPDTSSRFFTEDFPYGLRFIYEQACQHHIEMPTIVKVYQWGCNIILSTSR